MKAPFSFLGLALLCLLLANDSQAKTRADCEREYLPKFSQRGKDVPWEPTSPKFAEAMLKLANTTATDRVYDLGAGDGVIVIAAAKSFKANAVGIEFNPDLSKLGQCYIDAEGLTSKARMITGDVFKADFSKATVVTLFMWPEVNIRLRPTLLNMPPGTRVVSSTHTMEEWKWDGHVEVEGRKAYLWIIPASVEATWTFQEVGGTDSFTLALGQQFQELQGKLQRDGKRSDITGSVRATQIDIDMGEHSKLTGALQGKQIAATVKTQQGEKRYVGSMLMPSTVR
ncbi:MAG TPA: class I SAM-dependent methyltransferase [Steroidobacteraceae bacterium]|nr:class I SAM-dependent methyltransferase [Steroidobacteraceae bacterium]